MATTTMTETEDPQPPACPVCGWTSPSDDRMTQVLDVGVHQDREDHFTPEERRKWQRHEKRGSGDPDAWYS